MSKKPKKAKPRINSRSKGKTGELEFAHYLEAYGIEAKRGQQRKGGDDSPDVITNLTGIHFEVKRTERTNLEAWMAQAVNDSNGKHRPVVAHRKSRGQWLAILPMDELMELLTHTPHWPQPPKEE